MKLSLPRLRKPGMVLGGVVLIVGLSSGIALASIPDSSGTIHACYKAKADGSRSDLGIIDSALSGGHCPSGQTEVDFNQTGPQGPAGATGATGAAGATGPSTAGPTGLDTTIVYNTSYSPSGDVVAVYCPSDHPYVLGGGGTAPSGGSGLSTGSGPTVAGEESGTSVNGWEVTGATNSAATFTVWAICAK